MTPVPWMWSSVGGCRLPFRHLLVKVAQHHKLVCPLHFPPAHPELWVRSEPHSLPPPGPVGVTAERISEMLGNSMARI